MKQNRSVRRVKYRVITVPFDSSDEGLTEALMSQASEKLEAYRYELHSMHQIEGRGLVLIFWRNFKT